MDNIKKIKYLVIHHSQREKDSAKSIKKRHLKRGWEDIGYHYIIGKKGKIYEGRKENLIGAHIFGWNRNSLGICMIGNFDKEKPTKKQIETLVKLLKKKIKENKIKIKNVRGHREFPNVIKSCPGKEVNLEEIRSRLKT